MEQDNTVPEISWFWRRWYTYISKLLYMIGVYLVIFKLSITNPLLWIGVGLIAAAIILDTLYIAGASVIDWAQVVASWKGKNGQV